jgi:hypothetical protein
LKYETPAELARFALLYGANALRPSARLFVAEAAYRTDSLENALDAYTQYRANLNRSCESIFTALFLVTFERQRLSAQGFELLEIMMKTRLIPAMYELFPAEFNFASTNMFEAKATVRKVIQAIETQAVALRLPRIHQLLLQKLIMLNYIDQLDRMFDFQMTGADDVKAKEELMANWDRAGNFERTAPNQFHIDAVQRAAELFKYVMARAPPSMNLRFVLKAMDLLKKSPDVAIQAGIVRSRNPAVFTFIVFLRTYVADKKMVAILLFQWEFVLIQRFIALGMQLNHFQEGGGAIART